MALATPPASVTLPVAVPVMMAASLVAVIASMVVWLVLGSVPSLTTHEIVRVVSVPKLVGLWLVDE